jgi:regulation of enolase protein 1 (concanavalin A-like superfamily)
VKAGVEFADWCPSVGAVVTGGRSDWSLAPTPNWGGHRVHLKVSRRGDAFTIRARSEGSRCNLSTLSRSSRTSLPRRTVHLRPDPSRAISSAAHD